jgi:4'-phosphopantetheinyl transferase
MVFPFRLSQKARSNPHLCALSRLKAAGWGLSLEMSLVEPALIPGQPARLLAVNGNEEYAGQWFLADLPPIPDYHAAIAAEGQNWILRCWRWTE